MVEPQGSRGSSNPGSEDKKCDSEKDSIENMVVKESPNPHDVSQSHPKATLTQRDLWVYQQRELRVWCVVERSLSSGPARTDQGR